MTYQLITNKKSPNYTDPKYSEKVFGSPRTIEAITIHHWGKEGQKFDNVVNWFLSDAAKTSAHYVVESGKVAAMVDPEDVAWHAGSSRGNATTIGIELRPEATDGDYTTAAELISDLRKVYGDLPLVPHNQWRATICPGKWDLEKLDSLARPAPVSAVQETYTVKKGDTLWGISQMFGMTLLELTKLNNISASTTIYQGQVLKVSYRKYTVQKGDTLWSISRKFGTTIKRLADLNAISNPDTHVLYAGDGLRIG